MKRFLLPVLALFMALPCVAQEPVVDTPAGKIIGRHTNAARDVEVYKGIPYAVPPVGSRRWKPAQATARFAEPLIADRFGPDCMQASTMDIVAEPEKDWYYHATSLPSEDCLYLNVWKPAQRDDKKLPVMVWIHGGGLVQGSGSWPLYDGAQLARKGVVLVTLNYRLGIFARFAHPQLTAESAQRSSGAYDMSDLLAALHWVQKNIAGFGGDPGNVTIFGESAGSLYVNALMATPLSKGLFHRAIGESGGALYDHMPTRAMAESVGVEFAKSIGQTTLAQLREVPSADLLASSREKKYYLDLVADGYFLPQTPCKTFLDGKQIDVPVLVGFNSNEHHGYRPELPDFKDFADYEKYARRALDDMAYRNAGIADGFMALLPKRDYTLSRAKRVMRGYALTGWEMESWAMMMSGVKSPAYLYYFNHVPAGATAAFHTAEVPYVFNNERDVPRYSPNMPNDPARPSDLELANAMSDYWVAFATTGVPAAKGLPQWQPYSDKRRDFMEFKDGQSVPSRDFFPEMRHASICSALR